MATEQSLRDEVRGLRAAVEALAGTLDAKVQTKVDEKVQTEVKAKSISRDEYRRRVRASGRRVAGGMVLLLVVIVLAVGWSRLTLQQAQEHAIGDFRRLVSTCRTTGPPLSPEDAAFCEDRVPGFSQARVRVQETAAKTRRNEQRLDRVERDLAKLLE